LYGAPAWVYLSTCNLYELLDRKREREAESERIAHARITQKGNKRAGKRPVAA
jgi:hypothetical protein